MEAEKLTPEEARHWYGEQDEFGNDLEWLRYNLTLTPAQRYEKHQRALESVLILRDAAKQARYRRTRQGA